MNGTQKYHLAVPVDANDHVHGAAHATVTLVEYGDFECPNCKQAVPAIKMLMEKHPGQLRLVFRHFPIEEVHPQALHAALAAETAGGQSKFWPMHDMLFDNQRHLKVKHLRDYAERLELNMTRYDADFTDDVYLQRIREHVDGARRSSVHSTPAFFINGTLCDVSFGFHALSDRIATLMKSQG